MRLCYLGMSLAICAATCGAQACMAQDRAAVADLVGQGMHLYYSRDLRSAHETFTAAIKQGSQDPRAYYFRAFCNMSLGRQPDAQQDFARGAELEAGGADAFFDVSRSLERIQGRTRMTLESYRQQARLAVSAAREQDRQRRYEVMRQNQPPAPPASTAGAPATAAPATAQPMPAADPAATATPMPATSPSDNPFGAPATPAPAQPMPTTPATPMPTTPAPSANPFGPAAPATPAPATPPASANPFGS